MIWNGGKNSESISTYPSYSTKIQRSRKYTQKIWIIISPGNLGLCGNIEEKNAMVFLKC